MKPALLVLTISALLAIAPPVLDLVLGAWLISTFEWGWV